MAATEDCQHETCRFHIPVNLAAVVGNDCSVDPLPTSVYRLVGLGVGTMVTLRLATATVLDATATPSA